MIVVLLLLAALSMGGCASTVYVCDSPAPRVPEWFRAYQRTAPRHTQTTPDSSGAREDSTGTQVEWLSPDLVIEVWDRYINGAYIGAEVHVEQSDDADVTGLDGKTDPLLVPINAGRVNVSVTWERQDGLPGAQVYTVPLDHSYVATRRVVIDAGPLRRR